MRLIISTALLGLAIEHALSAMRHGPMSDIGWGRRGIDPQYNVACYQWRSGASVVGACVELTRSGRQ